MKERCWVARVLLLFIYRVLYILNVLSVSLDEDAALLNVKSN